MPAPHKHTSFGAKVWGKDDSGVTRVTGIICGQLVYWTL